jgi:hypothetical protein
LTLDLGTNATSRAIKSNGLKNHMGRTVAPGYFQHIAHLPIIGSGVRVKGQSKLDNARYWLVGEHLDPETDTDFDAASGRKAELSL